MIAKSSYTYSSSNEETPGIGVTLIPFDKQWFNNNLPGSDNKGVPASDIKDKILPSLMCFVILESCFFSLNL